MAKKTFEQAMKQLESILHLFGVDYEQLTFHYNGREQALTSGRDCRVVREILA